MKKIYMKPINTYVLSTFFSVQKPLGRCLKAEVNNRLLHFYTFTLDLYTYVGLPPVLGSCIRSTPALDV